MIDHTPFDFRLDPNASKGKKTPATTSGQVLIGDTMSQIFKLRDRVQMLMKILELEDKTSVLKSLGLPDLETTFKMLTMKKFIKPQD